jgi:CMP-2-keto-3-deoxyoctulosonic acid synthetase
MEPAARIAMNNLLLIVAVKEAARLALQEAREKKNLLAHVIQNAKAACDERAAIGYVVLTDSQEVAAWCETSGEPCVCDSREYSNLIERAVAAFREGQMPEWRLSSLELVTLLYVGEVEVGPKELSAITWAAEGLDPQAAAYTLARPIRCFGELTNRNWDKVVTSTRGRAMYFTRSTLPGAMIRLAVTAFRPHGLREYQDAQPTPLEQREHLAILRLLEHDLPVHVVRCDRPFWSIHTADVLVRWNAAGESAGKKQDGPIKSGAEPTATVLRYHGQSAMFVPTETTVSVRGSLSGGQSPWQFPRPLGCLDGAVCEITSIEGPEKSPNYRIPWWKRLGSRLRSLFQSRIPNP